MHNSSSMVLGPTIGPAGTYPLVVWPWRVSTNTTRSATASAEPSGLVAVRESWAMETRASALRVALEILVGFGGEGVGSGEQGVLDDGPVESGELSPHFPQ